MTHPIIPENPTTTTTTQSTAPSEGHEAPARLDQLTKDEAERRKNIRKKQDTMFFAGGATALHG